MPAVIGRMVSSPAPRIPGSIPSHDLTRATVWFNSSVVCTTIKVLVLSLGMADSRMLVFPDPVGASRTPVGYLSKSLRARAWNG